MLLRSYLWIAMKFSRHIIAVSENTKRDLVELYGIAPERVTVVHNGYDREAFNSDPPDALAQRDLKARYGITRPYLFHHGTVQPRKNLERLIRAHRLLLDRDPSLELDLVLVGSPGWLYKPILACGAEASCSRGRVIFTGPLPDSDLALLLKGAEMCVIPSLYEGFCLPMVEAMACGVPTITSNSSCFPEVSGGVLKYFDPLSIDEMACTIESLLDDKSERNCLIENGLQRAGMFSWHRSARETMQVLVSVAKVGENQREHHAASPAQAGRS
jgi:glycosyltransferase involved in cell wall biosynthesis